MGVGVCDCLWHIYGRVYLKEDIYEWVWLFRAHLWIGMSGCDCLKHINGWVCLFRILSWMGVGGCDCWKHIYGWVYLFRIHLWMGVGVCDCLKHIYEGFFWFFFSLFVFLILLLLFLLLFWFWFSQEHQRQYIKLKRGEIILLIEAMVGRLLHLKIAFNIRLNISQQRSLRI